MVGRKIVGRRKLGLRNMNTDFLVNNVLFGISKQSGFSQGIDITFESKNKWNGRIRVWVYPFFYAHGGKGDTHSWHRNDFSELYLVEKDPTFLAWKEITFHHSDTLTSYVINLQCNEKYEPHRSHYSGHIFAGWRDFVE